VVKARIAMGIDMVEKRVFIQSGENRIEGLVDNAPGEMAVVVTHPHPFYGGDMYNNVVASIVDAYQSRGYATLRFNFRGVGQSDGSYDQGMGEEADVSAALGYLCDLGKSAIDLAGYSFGAWVNARSLQGFSVAKRIIMISPPVNFMDFSFLEYNEKIQLVITGSEDDIAPPRMIKDMLPTWNPEANLEIIQGADHFYWGKTEEMKAIMQSFLECPS
jgi:alpha/beta superfamily hydrolase